MAKGFIPAGLQSSPKTCHHSFYRHTACEEIATAAQPSGDKSPHHKDAVHIPGCCLCEERTPCGWQIYQSCRDSLWRGDSSPLGCKAAPKPASTVSTGTPRVSKWRLLRSRAGINPLTTKILFTSRDVVCVRKVFLWLTDLSVMQGLPVARGFIPAGLQSSPKTCHHSFYRHTACEQIAPASQPSGGLPVARGFIPAGLQSSPKTCHHSFYRHTACEQIAPAAQPSGDKSPHHKDTVHIPGCCLCEEEIHLFHRTIVLRASRHPKAGNHRGYRPARLAKDY